MKPNFALTLSFDGIGLLRRAYMGWHHVGDVALDRPDLTAALIDLRRQAEKFAPSGFTTKLVIPDGQIKYLDLPTDDTWAEDRAGFVASALEGATPYDLPELAYDWSVSDGRVQIAAVARETLAEAQAFAMEHDFAPVSFVALPAEECFTGEPFFGMTSVAGQYLADGETVDRDMTRIHVIPVQAAPLDDIAPDATNKDAADTEAQAPEQETPEPAAEPESVPVPDENASPAPVAAAPKLTLPSEETAPSNPTPKRDGASQPKVTPAPEPTTAMRDALAQSLGTDSGEASGEAAGFTSIRAKRHVAHEEDAPRLEGVSRLSPLAASTAKTKQPASAPPLAAKPSEGPRSAVAPKDAKNGKATGFFSRRSAPVAKPDSKARSEPPRKPAAAAPREAEKQRMTIFGAREQQVGGKPRYLGLILTAALIVFLVAMALWASTLDAGLAGLFKRDAPEQVASATQPDPDDPVALATGEITKASRVVVPDAQDKATQSAPSATPSLPAVLTAEEARARYAATGIWQLAPTAPDEPTTTALGSLGLTRADLPLSRTDPSALLRVAALSDLAPAGPGRPAQTPEIRLDAEPLVAATEGGALTAEGVRIFAGQPERVPPRDMARPDDNATAEGTETPETTDTASLGSLAEVAPKPRPEDLADAVAPATADPALAGFRPKLRPQNVVKEAAAKLAEEPAPKPTVDTAAINAAVAAASTASLAPVETPERGPFITPTRQAVQVSPQPKPRPNGFAAKVERARKVAATHPVPAAQSIKPSRPSAGSVTKQATEKNVINLRRVNLIGVYGSASSRRALVRLSNGRYKKVKVGDRLDGGKVAAIGSSELRYVKRGKNVVLTMPRG
ncbi:hypothetical protein ACM25N_02160 [Roseovarius sp. C7]|uniref:hypothetical protein n=1 Tax=Roseovarius sp. C7 TaxID=3398643 RepID=UPI0039F61DE8